MTQLYAEVAVHSTFPHRQTFSYAVPAGLDVRPGHAVYVPFGRRTLQGVVVETHETPVFAEPEKIREIAGIIGERPLLDERRVALARWIADYYLSPVFDAVALLLPPGFERRPLTVVRPLAGRDELDGLELTDRQREALAALVEHGPLDVEALRERVSFRTVEGVVGQLEGRGLALRDYTLARPRVGPKTVEVAALDVDAGEARRRIEQAATPRRSRRAELLEQLLRRRDVSAETAERLAGSRANLARLVRSGAVRYDRDGRNVQLAIGPEEAEAEVRRLRSTRRAAQALAAVDALQAEEATLASLRAAGVETPALRWLQQLGVVRVEERPVERSPLDGMPVARRPQPELLPAQAAAAAAIERAVEAREPATFLLHGVTGSGKTEVYLRSLDACVRQGRRGIVLVPEIALTPQTIRRFRERFERVAVLHSALSEGEAFDQWHGIADGRYDVVVGPRSAVFAPQPELGLIVIDEEHEWTYKQNDPHPRYHARDVALELARLSGATVVLGSATPDVVSYEKAQRGEHRLLTLAERIRPVLGADGAVRPVSSPGMPRVTVVDMRDELRAGNRSMFSAELRQRLEETLAADEQAILFLNRRGMAGHVQCRDCGFVPDCSNCSVALAYHRQYDRLVCHQCHRRWKLPATCRQCGSPRVRLVGAGVEKVEAEAARAFPEARLLRWDRDVTRGRRSHERILASFLAGEADILIGTQMVAKGLDMPGVTLVGVVNADIALHLPDFRAGERTFQLLTQVAGRAGRGERPGAVVIQTYSPEHYAIDAASRYDYQGFAARELEARRETRYPPYTQLVRLTYAHANARSAREEALRMARELDQRRREAGSDGEVLGPSPAYVPRVRGRWRWQLLVRGRDPAALVHDVTMGPEWAVDVDPA